MERTENAKESRVFQRVVVTGALIGAGFVAGLLALRPSLDGVGRLTDGRDTFTAYDPAVRKVIYEVDPGGPRFTLPPEATRHALGADFVVAQFGERGADAELRVAPLPERGGEEVRGWQTIAALSAASDELAPVLRSTEDGQELLFASDRSGSKGGLDLWSSRVLLDAEGRPRFGEPTPLAALNTVWDESDPAPLTRSLGGGLVFVRDRDLYLQRRAGEPATRIDALSSDLAETEPSAGEYGLYFTRVDSEDIDSEDRVSLLRSAFTSPSPEEPREWRSPRAVRLPAGFEGARAPKPSLDESSLSLFQAGDLRQLRSRPLEMRPGASDLALWILLGLLLLLALLASLSHRWRGLEIVTKCLLLSLLLHLLALWAMRYLYPAEPEPLPEETAPRIRLRLETPSDGPSARNAARGGSLEGLTVTLPTEGDEPAPPEFTPSVSGSEALAALSPAAFSTIETPRPEAAEPSMPSFESAETSFQNAREQDAPRPEDIALSGSLSDAPSVARASAPAAPRGLEGMRPGELDVERSESATPSAFAPAAPTLSSGLGSRGDVQAPPSTSASALTAAAPTVGFAMPSPSASGTEAFEVSTPPATQLGELAGDAPTLAAVSGSAPGAPTEPSFDFEPQEFEPARPSESSFEAAAPPALADWSPPAPREFETERPSPPELAPPTLAVAEPPPSSALAPPSARLESEPLPEFEAPPAPDFDDPFAARFGDLKEEALEKLGGSKETEAAVARGLEYLASRQTEWGAFGTTRTLAEKYGDTRVGKTGLALLAFLGAGHLPESDSPYSDNVTRGIAWLCNKQLGPDEQGAGHFGDTTAYSHAIATYAISEAYALKPLPELLPYLRRAVRRIESEQQRSNDDRFDGGWGYYYPDGHTFDRWPRVSVTSWQVMALCSARRAGMEVEGDVLDAARRFLKGAWDERRGAYRYTHDPERLSSGLPILPGSTGAALFALSLLGEDPGSDEYAQARRFLVERRPRSYGYEGDRSFVNEARGNLYFSYTASLALIAAGQESDWRRYNLDMTETLLEAQREDGSWRPDSPYADYAQDTRRDRIYTTSISVLCLEVYYRYLTPLVKPFAKEGE